MFLNIVEFTISQSNSHINKTDTKERYQMRIKLHKILLFILERIFIIYFYFCEFDKKQKSNTT